MIIGILIGIGIWQLVGLGVCLMTDQDEEKVAIAGILVPYLILSGLGVIYKKARLAYFRKNYSWCVLYRHKEAKEHSVHGCAIRNKDIDKYFHKGENEYYIKIIRTGKDWKSAPYETITKVRKNGFLCQEWVDKNFKK